MANAKRARERTRTARADYELFAIISIIASAAASSPSFRSARLRSRVDHDRQTDASHREGQSRPAKLDVRSPFVFG